MSIIKHCPHCGNTINEDNTEFCTECGCNLYEKTVKKSKGFFDNLVERTNISVIIFSLVIFGIFLFIGTIIWSSFLSNGSIDLATYLILTIIISVFFGGFFTGYFGCKNKSYIIPNFSMYLGSIFAVILCGIGLIFTFLIGIVSSISSAFSSMNSNSLYGGTSQITTPNYMTSMDLSLIFKIILFILLIPVAAYFGIFLGSYLKQNI